MKFESEDQCCEALVKRLKERFQLVVREVPFISGTADVVALDESKIVAVEVKLRDFRRAIRQAQKHFLFADQVYVALPTDLANRLDWNTDFSGGIGLLAVAEESVTLVCECVSPISPVESYAMRIRQSVTRRVASEQRD